MNIGCSSAGVSPDSSMNGGLWEKRADPGLDARRSAMGVTPVGEASGGVGVSVEDVSTREGEEVLRVKEAEDVRLCFPELSLRDGPPNAEMKESTGEARGLESGCYSRDKFYRLPRERTMMS